MPTLPPGADGGESLRELVDVLSRNANIPVGEAVSIINGLDLRGVEELQQELKKAEEAKYLKRNEDNDMGNTNLGVELYNMKRELEAERKKTLELRARIKHIQRKLEEL